MPEIVKGQVSVTTVLVYIAFSVGVIVIFTSPFLLVYYLFRRRRVLKLGKPVLPA
jgi:hypothetical protein